MTRDAYRRLVKKTVARARANGVSVEAQSGTLPHGCNQEAGHGESSWGTVYVYMQGEATPSPARRSPAGSEPYYKMWHEVCLKLGDRLTVHPDTIHWFQSGPEGAIVSEFSTKSRDELDRFTDPRIE